MDLLAEHGDTAETPIPVAIETSRGLLVATLRQVPRKVCPVNPMAASRCRDRHGVSRKKSDPGDALVLANIIRTDAPVQRPLPADTDSKPQEWEVALFTTSGSGTHSVKTINGPETRHHPQNMPFNQPSPRCSSTTRRSSACRGPTPPQ